MDVRNLNLVLTSIFYVSFFAFGTISAQVKVAADPDLATPAHSSAILDVVSNNKGMLPPRMTRTQRNSITAPAEGLMLYNTTDDCLNEYIGGVWITYCDLRFNTACNCVQYLKDNGLPTQQWIPLATEDWTVDGNTGTNPNSNFLGTIDNQALTIRTNNIQKWRFEPNGTMSFLNTGNSVYVGFEAGMVDDQSNNNNTFVGNFSGRSSTIASFNGGFGYNSLRNNVNGLSNTAIGASTLLDNTSGHFNTAVGVAALADNTTGDYNVAVGIGTLDENLTGNRNTAIGPQTLTNLVSGSYNIAIGASAVASTGNSTALPATFNHVIGIGNWTYTNKSTGDYSVAIGYRACNLETTGSHNTAVGGYALNSNRTGTYNTAVGYSSANFAPSNGLTNGSAFGYGSVLTSSNKVRLGNTAVTVVEGQVAYSWPSDGRFKSDIKENVPGIEFVMGLRPVTYKFDTKKFDEFLHQEAPDSIKAQVIDVQDYSASQQITHTGFVAQEIETLINELGYDFDGLNVPTTKTENYSVSYSTFVVPLVKAVQEQQVVIEKLKEKEANTQATLDTVLEKLAVLEKLIQEK